MSADDVSAQRPSVMLKVMSGAYFAAEDGNHVMLLRLLHLSELLHFTLLIIGFWSTHGLTIQTALYILLWLYKQFVIQLWGV